MKKTEVISEIVDKLPISDAKPLGSRIDQVEHQMVLDENLELVDIDRDTEKYEIVSESGEPEDTDKQLLERYIKEKVSPENIVSTFKENTKEAVLKLLALQSDESPLKVGGVNIGFRTELQIRHCKMTLNTYGNILYDIIAGTLSSYPESQVISIVLQEYLPGGKHALKGKEYTIRRVFTEGAKELESFKLTFENVGPDKKDTFSIPISDLMHYESTTSNNEVTRLEIIPSDFFKVLTLSSKVIHGAHYNIENVIELSGKGKYITAFYYWLEDIKGHQEYPGAIPGYVEIYIEELVYLLDMPSKTPAGEIKRRLLDPAKRAINELERCDFIFDYEDMVPKGKRIVGFKIKVTKKKDIIEAKARIENKTHPIDEELGSFLKLCGLKLTEVDIRHINEEYIAHKRDIPFMFKAKNKLDEMCAKKDIKEEYRVSYLIKIIQNGIIEGGQTSGTNGSNEFSNFPQSTYNYEEIEASRIRN